MEEEHPRPKEITIRLNLKTLKKAGYVLMVLVLMGIVTAQFFEVIPSRSSFSENTITGQATINNTSNESDGTANSPETEVQEKEETDEKETEQQSEEDSPEEDTEEDNSLPITGKITLSIDKLNIAIKGEDYARIKSVKFTVKNQKSESIAPKISAHLAGDIYDVKDLNLEELESGDSITKTSSDLNFGYNDIDQEHTLKIELYDENKNLLDSVTESFDTR